MTEPTDDPSKLKLTAVPSNIRPGQAWTQILLPAETIEFFGGKGRFSVRLMIGDESFRTSIFPVGDGTHHVMFNKSMRAAAVKIGWTDGQPLAIELIRDDSPREEAPMPQELADVLADDAAAKAAFDKLASSHRKAYMTHVRSAKQDATRKRRAEKCLQMIRAGTKPDF